jgi:hypothetical protein
MTTFSLLLALAACGGSSSTTDTATSDTSITDTATSDSGSSLTAEDCTSDQVFANVCTSCGPTDACTERQDLCLATCTPEQQWQACADGGTCMDGVCYPAICG